MNSYASFFGVLLLIASTAAADTIFYTDQILFENLYTDLTLEDYSNTNIPPDGAGYAEGPFNSATDNDCFSPGDIVDGISFDNTTSSNNVVFTPPISGLINVSVGPQAIDITRFSFSTDVNTFGVIVLFPLEPGTVSIEVFGGSGSIGSSSSGGTLDGVFWGVHTDEEIKFIEFEANAGSYGILFANPQFGAVPQKLESLTWASIKNSF